MSREPGRIERVIETIMDAEPDNDGLGDSDLSGRARCEEAPREVAAGGANPAPASA
jgi:hypothetical protein